VSEPRASYRNPATPALGAVVVSHIGNVLIVDAGRQRITFHNVTGIPRQQPGDDLDEMPPHTHRSIAALRWSPWDEPGADDDDGPARQF
jgi:hypothetical protein